METREAPKQKMFFVGQAYDAFELLAPLAQRAGKSIALVDDGRVHLVGSDRLGGRHPEAPTKLRQSSDKAPTSYLCQRIKLIGISGGRSVPFKQPAIFGKAFEDAGCRALPAADMPSELRRRNLAV